MSEQQYLDLIKTIIETGEIREERTGVGTLAVFGVTQRWNLATSFPLLTTKSVPFRMVFEELMWFLRGSTDARELQVQNVHIWDGNSSREFLDKAGLTSYVEGDIGPGYGFQWRHFGAKYKGCDADYTGQGVDQVAQVIEQLKTNPTNRRIILSAWNPAALKEMALPPCHMMAQFYVSEGRHLSCLLNQRSADVGLGVPFNIASYALLTCLLAHHCDLVPRELIHVMGDTHIYKTHIEALREQATRTPGDFPTLVISGEKKDKIEDYTWSDLQLVGNKPQARVKMEMAV